MIDVGAIDLYDAALVQLKKHAIRVGLRGRLVQIFLAIKYYQSLIPTASSGVSISSAVLQGMLDDLFSKSSRPADDCVLSLFGGDYLARTGLIRPGNAYPQNTWRNNLNLQKGVGCYADASALSDPEFRVEHRVHCPALVPGPGGSLAHGYCGLSKTKATYRNEENPKWLRIDPDGAGYSVVDPLDLRLYAPCVAPNGNRLPLLPMIVALYHDAMPGLVTATRLEVGILDFMSDFNFDGVEMSAYFDASPQHPANSALYSNFPAQTMHTPIVAYAPLAQSVAVVPTVAPTLTAPPKLNSGWHAEQYVEQELRNAGWVVHNVSKQKLGYDLIAQNGAQTRYIEVKSSIGLCSPTLTMREWQQSKVHQNNYVLAVLENFNSSAENKIFWVVNPSILPVTPVLMQEFTISRGNWTGVCVAFSQI